ncbi:MAG: hypothetical protein RR891_07435 [Clostridium sp.]
MDEHYMASRHLGQFFELSIEYNMDEIEFTLATLNSEYKRGIEIYQPQWYSQSKYYYFEEFMEQNKIKNHVYGSDEITYEKERMYWLGYCLQDWGNRGNLTGNQIATTLGKEGISHLINNYKIYHTVDPMYVLEDCIECLNINFNL